MELFILQWVSLLARWLHVVAGIAWIGSSFYFFALDASLRQTPALGEGIAGEAWQVHGGGFYRLQKYLIAPDFLPKELTWFKWEAYVTWIAGFILLLSVYYAQASFYLIDPRVADLTSLQASVIGIASLGLGWIFYDRLCKSVLGKNTVVLAGTGFAALLAVSYGYLHIFSGRGAYIHVGALIGSIMVGNVFFLIIPNQKKVVADLLAGRAPNAELGEQAKQRSLHNNYLTLPVVFIMLSNHYPFLYEGQSGWLVLIAVFVAGFLIRHHFNLKHSGVRPLWWLWPAAAAFVLGVVMLTLPQKLPEGAARVSFADVRHIVDTRCQLCHSQSPQYAGLTSPPKGIAFDTADDIKHYSQQIYEQVVLNKTMPLNNITHITDEERSALASWIQTSADAK
jgi:uncharacterized membrane protein